jgi:hypothetical protein
MTALERRINSLEDNIKMCLKITCGNVNLIKVPWEAQLQALVNMEFTFWFRM